MALHGAPAQRSAPCLTVSPPSGQEANSVRVHKALFFLFFFYTVKRLHGGIVMTKYTFSLSLGTSLSSECLCNECFKRSEETSCSKSLDTDGSSYLFKDIFFSFKHYDDLGVFTGA